MVNYWIDQSIAESKSVITESFIFNNERGKEKSSQRFPPIAKIVELDTLSPDIIFILPRYWITITLFINILLLSSS